MLKSLIDYYPGKDFAVGVFEEQLEYLRNRYLDEGVNKENIAWMIGVMEEALVERMKYLESYKEDVYDEDEVLKEYKETLF